MIVGIGTDICRVARMGGAFDRHGERLLQRLLADDERDDCLRHADRARFLAKRFAAKEAFAKALGTGVRGIVRFKDIEVTHDAAGKPLLRFHGELSAWLRTRDWLAHVSVSDEQEHALAFVVIEARTEKQ